MSSDNVMRFRTGLAEIMAIMDDLKAQAVSDRNIFKNNPKEGLSRAERRAAFLQELHNIVIPDDIEVQMDMPNGPTVEKVLEPLYAVVDKYGLR
jgi:hypothetical protein